MTVGISDRKVFAELRRTKFVGHSDGLSVRYVLTEGDGLAVAYAIGTKVGGAVERNRLRRQLREVVLSIRAQLPDGAYLISVRDGSAVGREFSELTLTLSRAAKRAIAKAPSSSWG
jgi:ribonuclease P protein component